MPIYQLADTKAHNLLDQVIEKWHSHLASVGLSVDLIMAYRSEKSRSSPVRFQGYPAKAVVRIVSEKDRVAGRGDCEILIDGEKWKLANIDEKRALLDHELTHIYLAGKFDDAGRPKLEMRKHDHQFGWFDEVVQRHGKHSSEFQQFHNLLLHTKQQWLPFMAHEVIPAKDGTTTPTDLFAETETQVSQALAPKPKRKKKGNDHGTT